MMKNEHYEKLMRRNPSTPEDILRWVDEFRRAGYSLRQPIDGRLIKEVYLHGRKYILIEETEERRHCHELPPPAALGYKGFVLREIQSI